MPDLKSTTLARLIDILESARDRKSMYFSPVEPSAFENWLSGLHTGCSLAGLEWTPEDRQPALSRRGLESVSIGETTQLAERGLGPEAIVDELLAIEIEMWRQIEGLTANDGQ